MAQNDFSNYFSPDLAKNFSGFPFDIQSILETQRKNFQALTEAQTCTIERLQAIAKRQSELLSEMMESNSAIAQELLAEGSPEQKVAKQTDIMKKVYEKTVVNMKEIGDMISASGQQASDILNKRVTASLTEIKSAMEKGGKAAKKAA